MITMLMSKLVAVVLVAILIILLISSGLVEKMEGV